MASRSTSPGVLVAWWGFRGFVVVEEPKSIRGKVSGSGVCPSEGGLGRVWTSTVTVPLGGGFGDMVISSLSGCRIGLHERDAEGAVGVIAGFLCFLGVV
jgi:hypothetical protein